MTTDILFSNDIETIKKALSDPELDVNVTNEKGLTPLMFHNDIEIVKLLLAHPNIDINKTIEGTNLNALNYNCSYEKELLLLDYPELNVHGNTFFGDSGESDKRDSWTLDPDIPEYYQSRLSEIVEFELRDDSPPILWEIVEKLLYHPKFDINKNILDERHPLAFLQEFENLFDLVVKHPKFEMDKFIYDNLEYRRININSFKKLNKLFPVDINEFAKHVGGPTHSILWYAIERNCNTDFVNYMLDNPDYNLHDIQSIIEMFKKRKNKNNILEIIMNHPRVK